MCPKRERHLDFLPVIVYSNPQATLDVWQIFKPEVPYDLSGFRCWSHVTLLGIDRAKPLSSLVRRSYCPVKTASSGADAIR